MPVEHHNPMETFATTAVWEGEEQITIFDKTQGAPNSRNYVADVLEMPREKVRVLSPFVGGGIRIGFAPTIPVAPCRPGGARLKRSVRVNLTRQQMFTLGYRSANIQTLALGAGNDGRLASFRHDVVAMTSQFEEFQRTTSPGRAAFIVAQTASSARQLVKLDQNTPCDMRGPGGAEGCMRSNARWMSSPMRRRSIRSSYD